MGKSGLEVSHFIPEPRNFVEVIILPANDKKALLKATLNEIKNLINNQTFINDDLEKGYQLTPCRYVYMANIQFGRSLDKIKLKIIFRRDSQNKEIIGDPWIQQHQ